MAEAVGVAAAAFVVLACFLKARNFLESLVADPANRSVKVGNMVTSSAASDVVIDSALALNLLEMG